MVPFFVLSVVGGNTKRKDRVVVADTPPQEGLSHNKTTWIVSSVFIERKFRGRGKNNRSIIIIINPK
jgi:hypothetical protein